MAQTAVIHTATRVIRRLTTDASSPVATDETAIVLAAPIDLAPTGSPTGFWKLTGANAKVAALAADVTAANVDPVQVSTAKSTARANFLSALSTAVGDATITGNMKTLLQRWQTYLIT